jgi:hypothetical protein
MKITKLELKKIIKEELNDVKEGWNPFEKSPEKKAQKAMKGAEASLQQFASYDKTQDPTVADPHTAAIDSLEDYIANHYPSDDALRELVENVQALVAEFEDDMQDKLAGEPDPYMGRGGRTPGEI